MGNAHFLLQNALTGFVFLVFTFCSLWLVNDKTGADALNIFSTQWQIVAVVLATPIVGLLVQSVYMFFVYLRGHPYDDESRKQAAEKIRSAINSIDAIPRDLKSKLLKLPNDSLFVWLYYSDAPDKLVEWARRRRDLQHLGENWTTASVLGLLAGVTIGIVMRFPFSQNPIFWSIVLGVVSVVWAIGLIFLRSKMKTDADALELTWTLARLYPDIKDRLVPAISDTDLDITLEDKPKIITKP